MQAEEAQKELEKLGISNTKEAFFERVEKNDVNAVKLFLDAGMDPEAKNIFDATPLMLAAYSGYFEMVRMLLEKGADVNTQSDDGITALMAATYQGHKDIVKELLDWNADVDLTSENGVTALAAAKNENYTEIIELLENAG